MFMYRVTIQIDFPEETMSEHLSTSPADLKDLAEFRFQLRRFLSFSEKASEGAGIAAQQYQLMQVIASAPEGQGASISYLAERMILKHNSTVELVDRAGRAGLVRRESDDEDLRRSLVRLTVEGEKMLDQLVPVHLADLDAHGREVIAALERVMARNDR
jgi:DNA-binding MarR family transcriptional regulator